MKRLICAAILLSGCAAKTLMQPPSEPSAAPAGFSAESKEQPQKSEDPACQTAECEDACKEAGDRLQACVAAFDAGCFSDALPAERAVCDWASDQDLKRSSDAPAKSAAEEEAAEPEPAVRPIEFSD